MAHRTEKEETTEFKTKSPTTPTTTPTNLSVSCQNCTTKPSKPTQPFSHQPHKTKRDTTTRQQHHQEHEQEDEEEVLMPSKKVANRCFGCRRKVGLTGFRCRCGELFCGEHRYSDRHVCSFDYKAAGRQAIERENPVVKAPKILRV